MNQYEPPKTDPNNKIHVADAISIEMTEDVYFSAKLQNRIRWALVFILSIGGFFLSDGQVEKKLSFPISLSVGAIIYAIFSKILPLANLTSTTKFKKFGDQMKMDKMNRKLGIGKYADKKED